MKARTCPHGKLLSQECPACEKMDKVEQHNAELIRLQGDTIKAQQVEINNLKHEIEVLKSILKQWTVISPQLVNVTKAVLGE